MGEDIAAAPCDSFGRVNGQRGLVVNDASLICDSPGVNPQGTVMLLARRNVLHHLGSL
jgi:choline dehydrogenase-like flavoprotein